MLNENIKTIRKNKGFTQEELATRLHVTRQTISKWEKGYSVPDAAMLSSLAEVLEVSVADLLGKEQIEKEDADALVDQLARINEQLAVRNRRWRVFWKTVLIILAVIIIGTFITIAAGFRIYSSDHDVAGAVSWRCALGDEDYRYGITYNDEYRVLTGGGDAYISDHADIENCADANQAAAQLLDYFLERGGSVKVIEKSGLQLDTASEVLSTIEGSLKTYYEMNDETWWCENHSYAYRLELRGRMPNSATDTTFVYLSNFEEISFDDAWKASGLSSFSDDYFDPEAAVLVDVEAE